MSSLIIRPEIYLLEWRDERNICLGQIITSDLRSQLLYSKPVARIVLNALRSAFHLKEEILAVEDAIDNSRLATQKQQDDIDAFFDFLDYPQTREGEPQRLTQSMWLEYVRSAKNSIVDF